MTKTVLAISVLCITLVSGCSVPMTGREDPTEAVPSPTLQPTRTPTPLREPATPSAVPEPSPTNAEEAREVDEEPVRDKTTTPVEAEEEKQPALFFFYADWCSACAIMRPVIEKLEQEYSDRIRFVMVDVDLPESRELTAMAGVRAIPLTVLVTASGESGQRWIGPRPESDLRAVFDEVLD